MPVIKQCEVCQKPYPVTPALAEGSRYCSRKCHNIGMARTAAQRANKRCTACGEVKPLSEFALCFQRGKMRPRSRCKVCRLNHSQSPESKEQQSRNHKRRYAQPSFAARNRERQRARLRTLRLEVVSAYGGRCACCGETTAELLAVDHINGGGRQHRKSIGNNFYSWLKRHNFPKDNFALLCHNCNTAKGLYGSCPHDPNHKKTVDLLANELAGRLSRARHADAVKERHQTQARDHRGIRRRVRVLGVTDYEFLSIDHIRGERSHEPKEYKLKGNNLYRWLRGRGFPKDHYQLLCHSCNMAKGFYGACPHQRACSVAA